jgi:hypothetical protein
MEVFMEDDTQAAVLLPRAEAARFLTKNNLPITAATLAKKAVTGGGRLMLYVTGVLFIIAKNCWNGRSPSSLLRSATRPSAARL